MKQMPKFFLFSAARYATIWYAKIFLSAKTYNEEFENVNPEYAAIRMIEQFCKRCQIKEYGNITPLTMEQGGIIFFYTKFRFFYHLGNMTKMLGGAKRAIVLLMNVSKRHLSENPTGEQALPCRSEGFLLFVVVGQSGSAMLVYKDLGKNKYNRFVYRLVYFQCCENSYVI
jgi:hypothetical protein